MLSSSRMNSVFVARTPSRKSWFEKDCMRVYNKLAAALPRPFTLKNGQRIDESSAHVALREAFINALVH